MVKASVCWKWIAAFVFLSGTVLPSSPGFCESLKDGVILRDNADLFLKDGSVVPCRRIVWLVEAADFVQCDQADHTVEIKLKDLRFEKTFGPALAREYAEMKGDLVGAHERSRREREAGAVTCESTAEPGTEQGPASSGPAELPQAAPEGDAGKGAPPEDLNDAMKTLKGDTRPSKAFNTARAIAQQARGGADCTQAIPLLIEKLDDGRLVMVVSSFGGYGGAVKHALVSIGRPAVPALIQRVNAIRPGSGGAGDRQAILALGEGAPADSLPRLMSLAGKRSTAMSPPGPSRPSAIRPRSRD